MRQNHSDCLPSLQVGLALLLMCCGLELEYVWLIFVILPVPHSLQGPASDGEQVGRGLPPILSYGQEHCFLSGDLLIQLVLGSEILRTGLSGTQSTSVLCPDQNRGQPLGREDRLATSPSWACGSYDILPHPQLRTEDPTSLNLKWEQERREVLLFLVQMKLALKENRHHISEAPSFTFPHVDLLCQGPCSS